LSGWPAVAVSTGAGVRCREHGERALPAAQPAAQPAAHPATARRIAAKSVSHLGSQQYL